MATRRSEKSSTRAHTHRYTGSDTPLYLSRSSCSIIHLKCDWLKDITPNSFHIPNPIRRRCVFAQTFLPKTNLLSTNIDRLSNVCTLYNSDTLEHRWMCLLSFKNRKKTHSYQFASLLKMFGCVNVFHASCLSFLCFASLRLAPLSWYWLLSTQKVNRILIGGH